MASASLAGLSGVALLRDPALNKGTAFTDVERDKLGLRGLLPPHVASQAEQVGRVLENLRKLREPLNRYVLLEALQDRNETLFYKVADRPHRRDDADHLHADRRPRVPAVRPHLPPPARAVRDGGRSRPRGARAAPTGRCPTPAIIVVTDGERILGLGDLGTNGMGIPIGKLALYTACAGIDPTRCLPILLDVGTNNEAMLNDPLYLGLKQKRLNGPEYDALVDEFVMATQQVFPGVLVQFEDFANHHAFALLERYRNRVPCFNDDIQGTAAVSVAGLFSALRVTKQKLADQRILFMGAGEAATGIADLATAAMVAEGVKPEEARKRSWLFDSKGLVVAGRGELAHHKKPYAHEHAPVADFLQAIEQLKPTAIIGVAATAGTFTEPVLRAMARINARPIVFALSNPTSKAECTAEQAYRYTEGRRALRVRQPVRPGRLRRHAPRAAPGQQLVHLPGRRARRDRQLTPDA